MRSVSEWWYGLTFHDVALIVIVCHVIGWLHHYVVIYLKLRIFRVTKNYLEAAEDQQIETSGVLMVIRQTLEIIKGWAELARIQTGAMRDLNNRMENQVNSNTDKLGEKIDTGTERVIHKIEQVESDSSIMKAAKKREDANGV